MELREHRGSFVKREPFVVSERILPAPEYAIVFVVSCLAFRFILVTRQISYSSPLKFIICSTLVRFRAILTGEYAVQYREGDGPQFFVASSWGSGYDIQAAILQS